MGIKTTEKSVCRADEAIIVAYDSTGLLRAWQTPSFWRIGCLHGASGLVHPVPGLLGWLATWLVGVCSRARSTTFLAGQGPVTASRRGWTT